MSRGHLSVVYTLLVASDNFDNMDQTPFILNFLVPLFQAYMYILMHK